MKLLRLSAWTAWFMLCFVATAAAEPISLIFAGIAGILKAGGIGAMLINAAFGIALKVGASLLEKARAKRQPQPGITGQLQVGGNNSISFLVGDYATAGSLEYTGEWGNSGKTPNAYHVQVVTLSDLPQPGIGSRIWINGQKCEIDFEATPVDQGYPVKEYRKGGNDHMWVKVLDGSQTEADPYLLAKFGSHPEKPWKSDMIGRGATVVVLTALINRELLTQLPAGRYEPAGLPLYDPRMDDTAGGEGPQRWGVPSTYEPTANPVVIIYNILRGIWYEGELLYGPAIPATRLPMANWIAAMNECDLPIEVEEDVFEPQYRCGYEIKVAEHQPVDVILELLKGCDGKIAEIGGVYKIHVGPPALPVAYIVDDDFMVTEEQEFEPFPGLENTFNGATASYPEPEAGWEMKDAPQRLFPEFEAEDDGRRLLADFQFNAAPHALQVQRLMKSMVADGRRFRKHRGTLGPWAFVLEPMDTISWTSVREGYDAKLFQLDSMDDQVNANQAVAFRETDPADFDWNFLTDGLPWSVGPIVPTWPTPQPVTGWQVLPAELRDASGTGRRPSIEVRFDGDLDDVRAVRVLVRLAASGAIVFDADLPYGEPLGETGHKAAVLNGVFLPAEDYEVQGQLVPYSARITVPSSWLPVTTPDVRLGGEDFWPIDIGGIADDIHGILEWGGNGYREVLLRLEEIQTTLSSQELGNEFSRQAIRQQITATYEDNTAQWTLAVEVIATETAALAIRIEELGVEITDIETGLTATAQAVSVLETYAGPDGVLANAITQLSAASGDGNVSEANFRMGAVAGPDGFSRIVAQTRVGGEGAWRGASWALDTPNDPDQDSRFVVDANQFFVTSGGFAGVLVPIMYADVDGVWIDNARIRNLDADNISTSSILITDSLQLGDNVVITGAIAQGAITEADDDTQPFEQESLTPPVNIFPFVLNKVLEVNIHSRSGMPIFFSIFTLMRATTNQFNGCSFRYQLRVNDVVIFDRVETRSSTSSEISQTFTETLLRLVPTDPNTDYRIEYWEELGSATSGSRAHEAQLVAQCAKA